MEWMHVKAGTGVCVCLCLPAALILLGQEGGDVFFHYAAIVLIL